MSGRIRTVKPEWLEDELLASCSDAARVLSIALILLADDHGRGRASTSALMSSAWMYHASRETLTKTSEALSELARIGFVRLYEVEKQAYFEIRTWSKHQKVQHPGRPRVPPPSAIRESLTRSTESLAPDLRSPISDHDLRPRPLLVPSGEPLETSPTTDETPENPNHTEPPPRDPWGLAPPGEPPDALPPPTPLAAPSPPSPKARKGPTPDLDHATLSTPEAAVLGAIQGDPSIAPIVARPATCARDLVLCGPGVDVPHEVRKAGAWLRANPKRAKKEGARFLLTWIARAQENRGGRGTPSQPIRREPPPPVPPDSETLNEHVRRFVATHTPPPVEPKPLADLEREWAAKLGKPRLAAGGDS